MRLIRFQIKNYKSIKESGICYFDDKITILAGKNEAGKTAILEALEDLNIDKEIREEAIPIYDSTLIPEIILWIQLNPQEINEIEELFKVEFPETQITLKYIKKYPKEVNIFYQNNEKFAVIDIFYPKTPDEAIKAIKFLQQNLEDFEINDNIIKYANKLNDFLEHYQTKFKPEINDEDKKNVNSILVKTKEVVKSSINSANNIKEFLINNYLPNFILFTTFDDILPDKKLISEAPNVPIINDLSLISSLDFKKIQPAADPRIKKMHEEQVNINFSEDYKLFWTQDLSKLVVTWDSNNIYFYIKENGQLYYPRIRSKGKQWHLAFYIRVTARTFEEKNNIILIDEPGLFLHAKAQKDILKKLESCCEKNQLIYTTHCPYLIPANKLNRVRLVLKDNENSTIISKLTPRADLETLTPILTAIGEDLSTGIRVEKKDSIIVEGYSDYLYLNAFEKILKVQQDFNFIPSVGATKEVYIGAILFGWGLEPIFLLDNDKEGLLVKKKLIKKLSIEAKRILQIPIDREGTIENLFSDEDYKKFIIEGSHLKGKILLAKDFYQKIENGIIKQDDLTKITLENFRNVFNKLNKMILNSSNP